MAMSTDLVLWQAPTIYDFEATDIPEELFRTPSPLPQPMDTIRLDGVLPSQSEQPVLLDQANRSRRRPYTAAEWNNIRPVITELYINRDMILRDVVQILQRDHDFHPTEQMCKKRIHTWGLSKTIKAAEKEEALEKLQHGSSPTTVCRQIPREKLIRYLKSRSKRVAQCNYPTKVVKHSRFTKRNSKLGLISLPSLHFESKVTRSLALPERLADTELLLRATREMMLVEKAKTITAQSAWYKVTAMLDNGMILWNARAFTAARSTFCQAAEKILENFQMGNAIDARLVVHLIPETWLLDCQSEFWGFVHFVFRIASEYLSPQHPMTLVARHLQEKDASKDDRLRMLDCMVDTFDPMHSMSEWWNIAQLRWIYCQDIGMYNLAAQYCREAQSLMRESEQLTLEIEIKTLLDLGLIHDRQGDNEAAKDYFERAVEATQDNLAEFSYCNSFALFRLYKIHKNHGEIDQASQHLKQCLELTLEFHGAEDADTISTFRKLLRFYQRNGLHDEATHLKEEYWELYDYLEEITEGLWNIDLNDDSSEDEMSDNASETGLGPERTEASGDTLEADFYNNQVSGRDFFEKSDAILDY